MVSLPEPSTALVSDEPFPEEVLEHARLLQNTYSVDGPERRVAKMTPALKRKFCEALANGASPTKAAKAIQLARSTVYYQRGIDHEFKEAWADALERAADRYEDRLDELAMEGKHPLPVFGMLRALRPEKWADKQDVRVTHEDATSMSVPPLAEQELLAIVKRGLESGHKLLPPPPGTRP